MDDELKVGILGTIFVVLSLLALLGMMDAGWEPCLTTQGYQLCAPR